jgi:hypothetical protein
MVTEVQLVVEMFHVGADGSIKVVGNGCLVTRRCLASRRSLGLPAKRSADSLSSDWPMKQKQGLVSIYSRLVCWDGLEDDVAAW